MIDLKEELKRQAEIEKEIWKDIDEIDKTYDADDKSWFENLILTIKDIFTF